MILTPPKWFQECQLHLDVWPITEDIKNVWVWLLGWRRASCRNFIDNRLCHFNILKWMFVLVWLFIRNFSKNPTFFQFRSTILFLSFFLAFITSEKNTTFKWLSSHKSSYIEFHWWYAFPYVLNSHSRYLQKIFNG